MSNGYYPGTTPYGGYGGYGGGMGYGGGYPAQPVIWPFGGGTPTPPPLAPPGGMPAGLAAPRTATFTVVARINEVGAVEVVDQYRGRPYLSPRDMRGFNKVKRLAKRLRRVFPSRRRASKRRR